MTRKIDHRRLGRLRQGQGEIANHIIDEFAAGRMSRRDFIRRASVVGISAPLAGSILAACSSSSSSSPAAGSSSSAAAGKAGAVIKVGVVTPTGAINPVTVADQGGLDMLGQTGEYLCLSTQTLTLKPVLATSWTPNSNGQRVDVQDPPEREVQQRRPADRRRRGVHLPAAHQPQDRVRLAVHPARHRAEAVRRGEGRRLHGRLPPGGPERQLPVPGVLRQLQRDHPAEGVRPGQVAEHVRRHRAVQARLVHAEVRGHVHPQRVVLGHQGAAVADPVHVLRRPERFGRGADRRDDRRHRAVLGGRRPGPAQRRLQRHQAEVQRAPRALHAHRPGAVHRPAGAAGDRALAQPAADRAGAVQGQRGPR